MSEKLVKCELWEYPVDLPFEVAQEIYDYLTSLKRFHEKAGYGVDLGLESLIDGLGYGLTMWPYDGRVSSGKR